MTLKNIELGECPNCHIIAKEYVAGRFLPCGHKGILEGCCSACNKPYSSHPWAGCCNWGVTFVRTNYPAKVV